jgi:hypothetical protein
MLGTTRWVMRYLLLGILRADAGIAAAGALFAGRHARRSARGLRGDAFRCPLFDWHFPGRGASRSRRSLQSGGSLQHNPSRTTARSPTLLGTKTRWWEDAKDAEAGDNYLGTERVLLAILGNEDGAAVRILARLDVSPETLEVQMFELCGRAS